MIFKTYLSSGFRNREVATLTKDSVTAQSNRLSVKARPQFNFNPKNYECRNVRVPASLVQELIAHVKKVKSALAFPTAAHPKRPGYCGGKPNAHHLEMCTAIAHRAGLNCGLCITLKGESCANGPCCEGWYLYKWRDTFATSTLRSGADIKTLQALLGHKNLSTTEKYLKALLVDDLEDKVEASAIAELVS